MVCKCYHADRNFLGEIGVCWGTKECEACSCGGDESKCDFYDTKKEEEKEMYTQTPICEDKSCASERSLSRAILGLKEKSDKAMAMAYEISGRLCGPAPSAPELTCNEPHCLLDEVDLLNSRIAEICDSLDRVMRNL